MASINDFGWGQILKVHEIGEYQIVEFDKFELNSVPRKTTGEIRFQPFINERDTSHTFDTLDEAIIFAIARNNEGLNGKAHDYFWKMIR